MKPNENNQAKKRAVAPGLYLDPVRQRYTYRPWVDGRRTERTLKARTDREARREFARESQNVTAPVNVTTLIAAYIEAGCPGAGVTPRGIDFVRGEMARCKHLSAFFGNIKAGEVRVKHCLAYKAWRVRKIKRDVTGGRTVDMDLGTLSNVFRYGAINGLVDSNPLLQRPRFRGEVEHCRDHCCRSGDELHTVARAVAGVGRDRGVVLALQFLFEACSGCRTGEVLTLRRDAKPGQPGHIREGNGHRYLCVARLKQGAEDPFDYLLVNPALERVLNALDGHHRARKAKSPWFFPGKLASSHMTGLALSHALGRVTKKLLPGRRLTSHGCRAFYVTWRRVDKIDLHQIAGEVGHQSGVALLLGVYGRRIPAWAVDFGPYPKTVAPYWDSTTIVATSISTGQHCATPLTPSIESKVSVCEALVHYLPNNRPVLEMA